MVTVKKGDTANLQCEVNGDKPINVVWLKNGKDKLTPSTDYRWVARPLFAGWDAGAVIEKFPVLCLYLYVVRINGD